MRPTLWQRWHDTLTATWYDAAHPGLSRALLPLAWLYGGLVYGHRLFARNRHDTGTVIGAPVIVIGNLTAGGTGKTPLVRALVAALVERGWQPGIVSRGYGGKGVVYPHRVALLDTAERVGDEPLWLARCTEVPVAVDPNRARGARFLVGEGCNIVVSDDGLQHWRLPRDREVAVVDARRGLGNGRLLPAGPLREPARRLARVTAVVANGGALTLADREAVPMHLRPTECVHLQSGKRRRLSDWSEPVHAVAGIGHPARFFGTLEEHGVPVRSTRAFPDHYALTAADLAFADTQPVLMTAKDAVKCEHFDDERLWYLDVEADLPAGFFERLLSGLQPPTSGEG